MASKANLLQVLREAEAAHARKLQIFSLDSEVSDGGQVTITAMNMAGEVVGNVIADPSDTVGSLLHALEHKIDPANRQFLKFLLPDGTEFGRQPFLLPDGTEFGKQHRHRSLVDLKLFGLQPKARGVWKGKGQCKGQCKGPSKPLPPIPKKGGHSSRPAPVLVLRCVSDVPELTIVGETASGDVLAKVVISATKPVGALFSAFAKETDLGKCLAVGQSHFQFILPDGATLEETDTRALSSLNLVPTERDRVP